MGKQGVDLKEYEGLDWDIVLAVIDRERQEAREHELRLIEEARARAPPPSTRLLPRSDAIMFGEYPFQEKFYLVVCDLCNCVIKPPFFKHHMEKQHPVHMADIRRRMQTGELNKDEMLRKLCESQKALAEQQNQEEQLNQEEEQNQEEQENQEEESLAEMAEMVVVKQEPLDYDENMEIENSELNNNDVDDVCFTEKNKVFAIEKEVESQIEEIKEREAPWLAAITAAIEITEIQRIGDERKQAVIKELEEQQEEVIYAGEVDVKNEKQKKLQMVYNENLNNNPDGEVTVLAVFKNTTG